MGEIYKNKINKMNINDVFDNSMKLINTRVGRDKTCRIIQYFLKFIVPILATQGDKYGTLKEKFEKLGSNMSLTRKVLRFGSYIPLIQNMTKRLQDYNPRNKGLVFWRTISDLSLVIYFLTDHPLYF